MLTVSCFLFIFVFKYRKIFDALRASNPYFAQGKLIAVEGDLTLPELGLTAEHRRALWENVDIVFHSAAIVKFDEPLR